MTLKVFQACFRLLFVASFSFGEMIDYLSYKQTHWAYIYSRSTIIPIMQLLFNISW